jgi:hypothetical protein
MIGRKNKSSETSLTYKCYVNGCEYILLWSAAFLIVSFDRRPAAAAQPAGGDYICLLRATPRGIHTDYTLWVTTTPSANLTFSRHMYVCIWAVCKSMWPRNGWICRLSFRRTVTLLRMRVHVVSLKIKKRRKKKRESTGNHEIQCYNILRIEKNPSGPQSHSTYLTQTSPD